MNASISKKETITSYFIAIGLIIVMVAAAVMLEDPEIILPEIAAMAIAMWVYREAGWIRQPSKIFLAPTFTAVIGFMVNQLPLTYIVKVILTLILMMLFLRIIRSNLAPSLATGLLPLVVNAHEWSFIIAVAAFTLILMLGVILFGFNKGLEKKVKIQYKYMIVFLVLHFIWIGLCLIFGFPQLAVIPPIVVVVYEVLQKPMYNLKMATKQVLMLTISASVGTALYFLIDSWVLVTLISMILMLLLVRIVGMRIPAVYAFPLLPFVFPASVVPTLPVAALVASIFMFGSVLIYKKYEMKRNKELMAM